MWSLRTRFTVLLVIAVVLVLLIAAFVTAQLLRKPPGSIFDLAIAEKAEMAAMLLTDDPAAAAKLNVEIGGRPDRADIDLPSTERLNAESRQQGYTAEIVLLDRRDHKSKDLVVHLDGDRWAYLNFPGPGPFPLLPLATYLAFVAIGMVAVAVYASDVMMRPLRVLDETVAKMRPDGVIPEIPETGPMEVRTTANTINRLASRLNAAISSRMRLVAAAGHDLRTPMTRMRLRAEFVGDEDERRAWLKDLEELDHIADSAIRLVREEVSPAATESVGLDKVVAEIAAEVRETGLAVASGTIETALVQGSPFALKRAIRNLVVNAATHGGGAALSLVTEAENFAVLTIADEGPGIPEALLGRVFEPFFRVDEARRQIIPGAGLGLAISREIIENHGGTVSITNRPQGGLIQTVRLPLPAAVAAI